jgi:hypothetical protein
VPGHETHRAPSSAPPRSPSIFESNRRTSCPPHHTPVSTLSPTQLRRRPRRHTSFVGSRTKVNLVSVLCRTRPRTYFRNSVLVDEIDVIDICDRLIVYAVCGLPLLLTLRSSFRTRASLQLEILALRHQLQVLNRSRPQRVRLTRADRVLWVWLSQVWAEWRAAFLIVRPETARGVAIRGFRLFWTWKSRCRLGRPGTDKVSDSG